MEDNKKKHMSIESTLLLTIGGAALGIIAFRIIYFIVTRS